MKIDHVYVIGHRHDLRYTQSCVASIRRWYPELPISLVKDDSRGRYDTSELEQAWDVGVLESERRRFGLGWAKLVPLLDAPSGQRCLILDSDILFVGRVIDKLESSDADFVVQDRGRYDRLVKQEFFDLEALQRFDPDFVFPGYTFNSGSYVGTSGLLQLRDFEPLVVFGDVLEQRDRDIFGGGDQGVLNYLLAKKAQLGEITVDRLPYMLWAGRLPRRIAYRPRLTANSPYPYLIHWAGRKRKILWLTKSNRLLRHFEAAYYTRIPHGRAVRFQRATRLAWSILTRQETLRASGPALDVFDGGRSSTHDP